MERYFKVSESELRELLHDSLKLCALESGGVDNWSGYGDSIQEWIEEFLEEEGIEDPEGLYNFYHAANKMIEDGDYPEVDGTYKNYSICAGQPDKYGYYF